MTRRYSKETYRPCRRQEWPHVWWHRPQEPLNRSRSLSFVPYESVQNRYSIDRQSMSHCTNNKIRRERKRFHFNLPFSTWKEKHHVHESFPVIAQSVVTSSVRTDNDGIFRVGNMQWDPTDDGWFSKEIIHRYIEETLENQSGAPMDGVGCREKENLLEFATRVDPS